MRIIRALIVLIFAIEGITKLLNFSFQKNFFIHWGYPLSFMYLIGTLELLGALGLLMPKTRLYSNICFILLMIGAFYTHISSHDPIQMMGLAIIVSILLIIHLVMYIKRRPTLI